MLKGTSKEIQRRVEKEVGNCNGKYDRMVNHHFAPLISRPRGNRACFIQQFIRSPSILALNAASPRSSAAHGVYRSAQQRPGPSADLPAIISDRRQNSQTSLQTEPTSLQFSLYRIIHRLQTFNTSHKGGRWR